jgi:glycosyltransferase involved in cell wall biosynthesis
MRISSTVELGRRFFRARKSRGWQAALRDAGRHLHGQLRLISAFPGRLLLQRRLARLHPAGNAPAVSIVLSTWNRAAMLPRAIDSVLAQTREDWELIIVDDGSEDDTATMLAAYGRDPRIRGFHQPHAGAGAARNAALAKAQAPVIAYIDSDNEWMPGYLAAMLAAFAERPALQSAYCAIRRQGADGSSLVHLTPFDAALLEERNFIDLNVFCHRRELFTRLGGFDAALPRLNDWDLVRRYARDTKPHAVPFVGAAYHDGGWQRLSNSESKAYSEYLVRRKDTRTPAPRLKVLYALWHYPQLSESYVETEIAFMRSRGVEIEAWSEVEPRSPHPVEIPVHRGSLKEAIVRAKPDLVHIHWLGLYPNYGHTLRRADVPVTMRAHGFEFTPALARQLDDDPLVRAVFVFPHQKAALPQLAKLQTVRSAFNPTFYRPPSHPKDRRLVFRASAGLPAKDLFSIFRLAQRLPEFRFVLAVVSCNQHEAFIGDLLRHNDELGRPVDLRINMSHPAVGALAQQAGIYLHTFDPAGPPYGMPGSIAEAMATGAYVVARRLPPAAAYLGEAGKLYDSDAEAEALLRETLSWSEADWQRAMLASVDRAYRLHVDSLALQPILDCWQNLAAQATANEPPRPVSVRAPDLGVAGIIG